MFGDKETHVAKGKLIYDVFSNSDVCWAIFVFELFLYYYKTKAI